MTDIVDWLRAYANRTTVIDIKRLDEAADEIEKLRAALDELLAMCLRQVDFNDDRDGLTLTRARAALKENNE